MSRVLSREVGFSDTFSAAVSADAGDVASKNRADQADGKGLATLLLAAVVAALLVAANEVTTQWTEGRLLAAWIVLWTVAFASLAALLTPIRRLAHRLAGWLGGLAERHRAAEADRQLWALALQDARVMADISVAMSRDAASDVRALR